MVIEFLTFDVEPSELEQWLQIEEQHWSRFLEQQDGFIKKEIWRPVEDQRSVHAVIWWESIEQWHSIPQDELDAVTEAMGPWERVPICTTFTLTRES